MLQRCKTTATDHVFLRVAPRRVTAATASSAGPRPSSDTASRLAALGPDGLHLTTTDAAALICWVCPGSAGRAEEPPPPSAHLERQNRDRRPSELDASIRPARARGRLGTRFAGPLCTVGPRQAAPPSSVDAPVDVVAVVGAGEAARVGGSVGVPAVDELGRAQRAIRPRRARGPGRRSGRCGCRGRSRRRRRRCPSRGRRRGWRRRRRRCSGSGRTSVR